MHNVQIACPWNSDSDIINCFKCEEGTAAGCWIAESSFVTLSKPADGPKRCELQIAFEGINKISHIDLVSSARIVEVYGTSSSGKEEYWQSNRAKEPISQGTWHCSIACDRKSKSPIVLKLFSLSQPTNSCIIKGLRLSYECGSSCPPPQSAQMASLGAPSGNRPPQSSGFEEMLSLAARVMPQATDIKKYCDMRFLALESKVASMESLLPKVDWLVNEVKELRQEVTELRREKKSSEKQRSPQCPTLKYAAAREERKKERRRSCPNNLYEAEAKLDLLRKHKSLTRSSSTPSSNSLERARRFFGFPNKSALQEWMRTTKTSSDVIISESPPDAAIRPTRRSQSALRPMKLSL